MRMQVNKTSLTNKEIWHDIPGYEGLYQVSSLGRVRSLDRIINGSNQYGCKFKNIKYGRILKQHLSKNGYLRVTLHDRTKAKNYTVHKLVAITFLPNVKNEPYINHKDENKTNNNVNNLEWCSVSYNINYGSRNAKVIKKLSGKPKTEEHRKKLSEVAKIANAKRKRNALGQYI